MQINMQDPKYKVLRNDKLFESLMVCFSCENSHKMRINIFSQHQLLKFPTCSIINFKGVHSTIVRVIEHVRSES